jgi:hypothetical protein
MGKMKNGILDSFSGTIGRVVGTSWRGVAVMRSKTHSRKNANTPKQQEQKAKFKVASDFTQSIHDRIICSRYGVDDAFVYKGLQCAINRNTVEMLSTQSLNISMRKCFFILLK